MADFKIRQGYSTSLFLPDGRVNPKLKIEEGCWYLCIDTACLFLGTKTNDERVVLTRINNIPIAEIQELINQLHVSVEELEEITLFVRINDETELPVDYADPAFNANITYYLQKTDGTVSTYIFDRSIQGYICTNALDTKLIRTLVEAVVPEVLETAVDNRILSVLSNIIIFGGDADGN